MAFLIVRHTQLYLGVYSIWLVSRTGREKRLEQQQITTLARAVGLLVLSIIGILALPSLSIALEKYGRPLPSMEQPDATAAREAEETLFGGYFLTAAFISNPTFAARADYPRRDLGGKQRRLESAPAGQQVHQGPRRAAVPRTSARP